MFNMELVLRDNDYFKIHENIDVEFSKSFEFNPKLRSEVNKVFARTLNNRAKFILGWFHLNIFDSLEKIVQNTDSSDDFIMDLSEFIADYFDQMDSDLNIKNLKDFNEFAHILKLSSIIVNNAVEENDMELIYEAFYQIESRFKKEKLTNNFLYYINHFEDEIYIDVNYDVKGRVNTLNTVMEVNSDEF